MERAWTWSLVGELDPTCHNLRSCMLQGRWKTLCATTKTQHSQINKYFKKWNKKNELDLNDMIWKNVLGILNEDKKFQMIRYSVCIYINCCCCFLLSCILLFATPWNAAYQAPLSFTISQGLLKFMSIELMLSNHLILCCPFSFLKYIHILFIFICII